MRPLRWPSLALAWLLLVQSFAPALAFAPSNGEGLSGKTYNRVGLQRQQLGALGMGYGVVVEFGYSDAFGIPYRVTANGGGRNVAGPGFFLNGQQWDGGSSWSRSYWSGNPAFNSGEGLYFNRARYYQPGLGRFVGEDPLFGDIYEINSSHRYRHTKNNPFIFVYPK